MKKGLIHIALFFCLVFSAREKSLYAFTDSSVNSIHEDVRLLERNFRLGYIKGFLIPHHEDMQHMYKHIEGFQLQSLYRIYSKSMKPLNKSVGYSISYYDLGSEVSGKAFSGALLVEADIYKLNSKQGRNGFKGAFQFGLGFGYLTQRYDINTNPMNRAIGSHLNGYMQLGILIEGTTNSGLGINISTGMSHFSNASWKYPNLGINLPYLQTCVQYKLQSSHQINGSRGLKDERFHTWRKTVAMRIGKKEVDLDDSRPFINGMMEFSLEQFRNQYSNFRYSLGYYHDRTYQYKKFESLPKYQIDQCSEVTLSVGYETRFLGWGIMVDLGIYAYKPDFRKKTPYYEAIGVSYQINDFYKAVIRLKANKTTADFAEFGISYTINE